MTAIELIANSLVGNLGMLKATLADFSDQEMVVRPVPAANHAMWQLGHLAASEAWFVAQAGYPGAAPSPPAEWAGKFKPENAKVDDRNFFPGKDEVLAYYDQVRAALARWVRTLTEADLKKPMADPIKSFAPTLGDLVLMFPVHAAMHVGQFQVIRRALGKPVLF